MNTVNWNTLGGNLVSWFLERNLWHNSIYSTSEKMIPSVFCGAKINAREASENRCFTLLHSTKVYITYSC